VDLQTAIKRYIAEHNAQLEQWRSAVAWATSVFAAFFGLELDVGPKV
jgi:hypothetical protein